MINLPHHLDCICEDCRKQVPQVTYTWYKTRTMKMVAQSVQDTGGGHWWVHYLIEPLPGHWYGSPEWMNHPQSMPVGAWNKYSADWREGRRV